MLELEPAAGHSAPRFRCGESLGHVGQTVIRGTRQRRLPNIIMLVKRIPQPPPRGPREQGLDVKPGTQLEPVAAPRFRRTDLCARRGGRITVHRAGPLRLTCAQFYAASSASALSPQRSLRHPDPQSGTGHYPTVLAFQKV